MNGLSQGLDLSHLKALVVEPALIAIGQSSPAAINLDTGTALVESECQYLKQLGDGPALGLWQMEPATEQDCWVNFLDFRLGLAAKVRALLAPGPTTPQLVWNLAYAAAMCRVRYLRVQQPLPAANDAAGMAEYWKNFYNSSVGAGVVDATHIEAFQAAIAA